MNVTSEQVLHVVQAATLAPSVHNTQPWKFRVLEDGFELYADRTRQLDVLDPSARQLHLSCGAALLMAVTASRALGLDASVTLLPSSDPDLLATVHLVPGPPVNEEELRLAIAVLERHTVREVFLPGALPDALYDVLRRGAESQGAMLRRVEGDDLVELQVLLSHADFLEEHDPRYREEVAAWVHDPAAGDGIPPYLVGSSQRASSLRLRDFTLSAPECLNGDAPLPEFPTVLLLTSKGDSPLDWLRSGMALSLILLHAAAAGFQAQPLGQVIDQDHSRMRLVKALSLVGTPQMVLRVGRVASTAPTPRRDISEVTY